MPPVFFTADELILRIDAYFTHIEGEFHFERKPGKDAEDEIEVKKIWDRDPQPATISGLALFLGFNSRDEFDDYGETGTFAPVLKRGRLSIEAVYERKLHQPSPTGAIFALKCLGWNDKTESKTSNAEVFKILEIKVTEIGPKLADNEKEVVL